MVAKRLDSKYYPGRRSDLWLKLPLKQKQEFVIGAYRLDGKRLELLLVGYFEPEGSVRHVFSPSFVKNLRTDPSGSATADRPKFLFAGKVHQGLHSANRAMLLKTLATLRSNRCPFANLPTTNKSHWGEGVTAEEMEH